MCPECERKFIPRFRKFDIKEIPGMTLYDYDSNIRGLLYQFKGCYDVELANLFLSKYKWGLHMLYQNYVIVPAPSLKEDNEKRGFNHVQKIFENINLPIKNIITKKGSFKQTKNTKKERKNIKKHLFLEDAESIRGKKVLIVDDVYTTGSTMKSLIALVKECKPKKIRFLVMSKTIRDH